jgi:hypothetical protein
MGLEDIAPCLGVKPELFNFDAGLGLIMDKFLVALPKLPAIVTAVPPPVNLPKAAFEFIIGELAGLEVPAFSITIDLPGLGEVDISLGNPELNIPDVDGLPVFDPQGLIDFIVGLIKVVIKLPSIIVPPDPGKLPDIVIESLGIDPNLPAIDGALFGPQFGKCIAEAIAGVVF